MGFKFASFGAATMPLSKIVIDKDLEMGTYSVKADTVKADAVEVDSISLRGAVDGAIGVIGVNEIRPTITASETVIYSKAYSASDKKTEVTVSCVIPEFFSGSINMYYTGNSSNSNRTKGYRFYKNDVPLQAESSTEAGTLTGTLDVNVSEGDTLKIVGYGSGGSYIGGTNFTIAFRGDITDGAVPLTSTLAPGLYPTTIPFTVEE